MAVPFRISKGVLNAMDPIPVPSGGKRPYHGSKQIKNQNQLEPGIKIKIHKPGENTIRAVVVCMYKECGVLKLDYQCSDGEKPCDGTLNLADYSVVRNEDLKWHPKNWIEKA